MADIFMSYVEEDSAVAEEIAQALEARRFSTWYYERNSIVGDSWLTQVGAEISEARAVILLISRHSLSSNQVTTEIDWARSKRKPLLPVRLGVTQEEIEERQVHWAMALGTIVTIPLPTEGVTDRFVSRLEAGLEKIGVVQGRDGAPPRDDLEVQLAEMRRLLNDPERRTAAEVALRTLAEQHPTSARVHRLLAESLNRAFRFREALAASARAVELEPDNALLLWEAGLAYHRDGRPKDATAHLSRAIEIGLDPVRDHHARKLLAVLQRAPV